MTQKTIDDLPDAERACLKYYEDVIAANLSVEMPVGRQAYILGERIFKSLKPKLTPVDMSVLINSGIDVKGYDKEGKYYRLGYLDSIEKQWKFQVEMECFKYCKPRMGYWFSARNFVRLGETIKALEAAGFSAEARRDWSGNIAEFRINGLKEGYCWPWEA